MLATALIVAAGAANAADLAYRNSPISGHSAFSWTGYYVGLNAGSSWGRQTLESVTALGFTAPCSAFSSDCKMALDGATVGGTVGFNVQSGAAVFGVEGDLNYSDFHATRPIFGGDELEGKVQWFGTLRGRLGYAYGALMPYVTGGLYVQHAVATYSVPALFSVSRSDNSVGWTVGGGVEYALSASWSVKGEYLYARADNTTFKVNGFGSADVKGSQNIVRAGLNYRY